MEAAGQGGITVRLHAGSKADWRYWASHNLSERVVGPL